MILCLPCIYRLIIMPIVLHWREALLSHVKGGKRDEGVREVSEEVIRMI
jgi:hypothetical protein